MVRNRENMQSVQLGLLSSVHRANITSKGEQRGGKESVVQGTEEQLYDCEVTALVVQMVEGQYSNER